MGCFSGPKVESSQLVAAFDAANSKGFDSKENLVTATATDFNYPFNNQIISTANDVAPDGTTVLCKHDLAGATSPFLNCRADITLSSGNTYTMSMYLKGTTSFSASFAFVGETTNEIYANTANITTTWQRFTLTFTLVATQTSSRLQLFFASQGEGKIVSVWGAQLEGGSVATNYTSRTSATAKPRGITLADLSGRSNTGALTYGPTYNSSNGGAIVFDGSNDCVVVNSNASVLSNTAYTKTVWFYVTSFASNNNLISGGNNGRHAFWLAGTNKLQAGHNSTWNTVSSATSLSLNTWYHAAVTFSTTTGWRLYLNGVLDSTNSSTSTVFSAYDVADALFAEVPYGVGYGATTTFLGSGEILLGGYGTGSNAFSGRISNASVYNRVLSATEVSQNFNALRGRFGI